MNMEAFPISGKDCTNVLTCLRILGLAFIVLSGLKTLKILNAFRLTPILNNSIVLHTLEK
jgi:hypothetical protein